MTSKILKYISGISLWIAGLALSTHLLIPHDHHINESFSYEDNNCPVSENKSGHKPVFPPHCHAFNDFASEKERLLQISQNLQFNFISADSFSEAFDPALQIRCGSIIDFQKPIFDSFTLELNLLRAPPALA